MVPWEHLQVQGSVRGMYNFAAFSKNWLFPMGQSVVNPHKNTKF